LITTIGEHKKVDVALEALFRVFF